MYYDKIWQSECVTLNYMNYSGETAVQFIVNQCIPNNVYQYTGSYNFHKLKFVALLLVIFEFLEIPGLGRH